MEVHSARSGMYIVQGYVHKAEFPTLRRAIAFIRDMGAVPVFCL